MNRVRRKKESVLGVYWRHVSRYPLFFAGGIIGEVIMQVAYLAAPLYLRQFFNLLTHEPSIAIVTALISTLAIIVVIWLVDWVAHRSQYLFSMYLELNVMRDLYESSFRYLLGHSYNFFVSNFAGSLTHRVSKYVKSFETLYEGIAHTFFAASLFIIGAIVVLFIRNWMLGAILAAWTVCFMSFQLYVSHLRQPSRVTRSEVDSRVTGNVADSISNQATVVLFSGVSYESKRFEHVVDELYAAIKRVWLIDAWIWMGIGLFMIAAQTALLYAGIHLWQQGLFTIGDFVLVQAYLLTAFGRLEVMNRELRRVNDAYSDAQEMVDILNTLHEVADAPEAKLLAVSKGQIAFKSVEFYFQEERGVLKDFDLAIRGGEKIALVGPSGAGKSTITKLMLRLFDVQGGSIEIDGQNIRSVTQESLRNSIAFVPQEPILFHRTLMENIRYGRRDASDGEVIEAAKQAHCHEFIDTLPLGYETYVGERGVKLSGGERQRVAIARAILKNAPILILDEATSSLDSASEVLIQEALDTLMHGKTVIVIAHRLSTIMRMDRILALEEGTIREEGTHQELLEKKGLYASLWSHQAGGFLQEEEDISKT